MDDMSYIDSLDEIDRELRQLIEIYKFRSVGVLGKENLIRISLEQNEVMTAALDKHRRVLKYMLGEKVEPVAHTGEAVLIGTFGGGAG